MVLMGCPNCGSQEHVKLDVDAYDASCYLKILSGFTHMQVEPLICLNCGTVYIDRSDLRRIKEKMNAKP
jgi:predicted RNA-binding Zn-ribbon protein involved in translation (DUF1610 family)